MVHQVWLNTYFLCLVRGTREEIQQQLDALKSDWPKSHIGIEVEILDKVPSKLDYGIIRDKA